MAEQLRRYKLSPELFPRYQYAVSEVRRAHMKYDTLTKQCRVSDAQGLPPFGDILVNILETQGLLLIEPEHLCPKHNENTDFEKVSHEEAKKLFDTASSNQNSPTVYVTRYSGDMDLPDYFGNLTILITGGDIPDSKFSRCGDMYICVSKRASFAKDVSDMLERYVFSHMRFKTELLNCMTTADVTEKYKKDLGNALNNIQSKALPQSPVSAVGNVTFNKRTSSATLTTLVEKNLQSSGVTIEEHVEEAIKIRPKLLDAVAEIRTMYKRSRVPEDEYPKTSKREKYADEQVSKELIKTIPQVLGVGYRLDTLIVTLDSSILEDKSIMDEIQSRIMEYFKSKQIEEADINFRFSNREISHFAHGDLKVGGCIRAVVCGTLGGFVCKGQPEDKKYCLISANHVLNDEDPNEVYLNVRNGNEKMIARTLPRRIDLEYLRPVDIAAAELEDTSISEPSHLDSSGNATPGKVYDYRNPQQLELLTGLPIHLWKANFRLGKGKITMPKYHRRIGTNIQNIIGIEDVDSDCDDNGETADQSCGILAAQGDSGSLVCADTPDGDFIHAIGMLMGEDPSYAAASGEKRRTMYVSCDLQSGMEHIQHKYQSTFTLCNSVKRESK